MSAKIVFTGGGTAGHVTPNIALILALQPQGWQIDYIGSHDGIEKSLIQTLAIPYHPISSGKLRRYFSWKNFLDPFHIVVGIAQAYWLLRQLAPDVVFSKGGFVAFPVVVAAWLRNIPVIAHESDLTPGLANRLCFPFVKQICVNFAAAKQRFKHPEKVIVTGTPIRPALFEGDRAKGLTLCGFSLEKPTLLVIGGSQGASAVNACVRKALADLSQHFQVIHICGKGKIDEQLSGQKGYCQFEFVDNELADLFAASDVVISRSGANTLCEILALAKPHVLVPLPEGVSRGDQVQNARYFQQQGISDVINESELTANTLIQAVDSVFAKRDEISNKIKTLAIGSATEQITRLIKEQASGQYKTTI